MPYRGRSRKHGEDHTAGTRFYRPYRKLTVFNWLRSFKDGKPVNIAFEAVKGGHVGVHEGQRLAQQIGENYTDGYTLVVVAGMNYAVHVESKGRDVLTSAEKQAEKAIAKELADLVTNIKDAFK